MAPSRGRKSQTEEGRAIIKQIVVKKVPRWTGGLRDWQAAVIAWILDGEDVLCITATGEGKSALFAVPILVLLEVAKNPAMYPRGVGIGSGIGELVAGTHVKPAFGSVLVEVD
ncbi:hypothetical protein B0H16DRAFT_1715982 [Mycena metata]|uniref:DEAD/DEAH-box helicase domain-containing protein n=1 Tax=Mycena metata TaxID=1033252 RepID=A0AAD7JSS8_9AGAR|nr:hypothetical protein B0H16DRAFT_1715982 [Mycena metata]